MFPRADRERWMDAPRTPQPLLFECHVSESKFKLTLVGLITGGWWFLLNYYTYSNVLAQCFPLSHDHYVHPVVFYFFRSTLLFLPTQSVRPLVLPPVNLPLANVHRLVMQRRVSVLPSKEVNPDRARRPLSMTLGQPKLLMPQ